MLKPFIVQIYGMDTVNYSSGPTAFKTLVFTLFADAVPMAWHLCLIRFVKRFCWKAGFWPCLVFCRPVAAKENIRAGLEINVTLT